MRNTLAKIGLVLASAACGSLASNLSPKGLQACLDGGCNPTISFEVCPGAPLLCEDFGNVDLTKPINLTYDSPGGFKFTSNVLPFAASVNGFSSVIPDQAQSATGTIADNGEELACRPGTYSLLAMPLDGVTPPITLNEVPLVGTSGVAAEDLAFATPDAGSVTIHGQVRADHLFGGLYPQVVPIAFTVQALNADQTLASQAIPVDADGGYLFDMVLAPQAASTLISLVVTPKSGTAPSAVFTRPLGALQSDAGLNLGDGIQTVTLNGYVGTCFDGGAVAGAKVTLNGVLSSDSQASSEVFTSGTLITDDGGNYSATVVFDPSSLHVDSYTALVVPDPASGLANTMSAPFSLPHPQAGPPTIVTLQPTIPVTGRILDDTGKPAPGATVTYSADPYVNPSPVQLSGPVTKRTAADGTFSFSLTPGSYDFSFSPPASLNLPAGSQGPVSVGSAGAGPASCGGPVAPQQLGDFAFSSGQVVTGTVADSMGNPMVGAYVKVFVTAPPLGAMPARSTQVSQAQVVTGGTFSVVVPAQ